MSQTLHCNFSFQSEKPLRYWWPLVFEAMSWQSFHFFLRQTRHQGQESTSILVSMKVSLIKGRREVHE
jgi:hypothetical protein